MPTMKCAAAAQAAQLTTDQLRHLVGVARSAAEQGGAELMRHYGRLSSIESKGRAGDLVTNADVAAERIVLEVLAEQTIITRPGLSTCLLARVFWLLVG